MLYVIGCKQIHNINQTTPKQFHDWYKLSHEIRDHFTRSNFNVNDG